MHPVEKEFYKRLAVFMALKLAIYIFIYKTAKWARKESEKC